MMCEACRRPSALGVGEQDAQQECAVACYLVWNLQAEENALVAYYCVPVMIPVSLTIPILCTSINLYLQQYDIKDRGNLYTFRIVTHSVPSKDIYHSSICRDLGN